MKKEQIVKLLSHPRPIFVVATWDKQRRTNAELSSAAAGHRGLLLAPSPTVAIRPPATATCSAVRRSGAVRPSPGQAVSRQPKADAQVVAGALCRHASLLSSDASSGGDRDEE